MVHFRSGKANMARNLITTKKLAAKLRTPEATVRYWRHTNQGPPGVRIGKRVLYDEAEVDAWIEGHFAEQS
jgi:predicted DNA-binding transcriptional regulator AlpA